MAKLGSSSCRPLLQGMMILLALLLLASIRAGPVMAQEQGLVEQFGKLLDHGGEKVKDYANKEFLASDLCKQKVMKRFCSGWKKGYTISKYLCKAQGLMEKQNTGSASFSPYFVVYGYGDQPTVTYLGITCPKIVEPQVPAAAAAAGTGANTPTLVPSSRYYPRNDVP